jgi:hypothetical protein
MQLMTNIISNVKKILLDIYSYVKKYDLNSFTHAKNGRKQNYEVLPVGLNVQFWMPPKTSTILHNLLKITRTKIYHSTPANVWKLKYVRTYLKEI